MHGISRQKIDISMSTTHLPVGLFCPFTVLVFAEDLYALVGGTCCKAFAIVVVCEVWTGYERLSTPQEGTYV